LVEGDLLVHDFIVGMPFAWPISKNKSVLNPNLDLTLLPGDNVYLRRENNIDVKIGGGSLTLLLGEEGFQMEGQLESYQGVFDYYNNKFILENAAASFRRFEGIVPTLHISAQTFVDGVRINIKLDGRANNMIITFTSQPELPEKEIIELLTQKGGLGEVFKGDEAGSSLVANFIKKEIIRLLQNTLQVNIISNLEESLQGIFSLDRMEINTYELGVNDEVTVRLGKNLTDKLYIEYVGDISSNESSHEWSFNYLFSDQTRLEGSWVGQDEYQLSIDTTFEF
jgi:translocation and assembly module TamB